MTTASLVCGVDDSRHARFALKVAERYARRLELRLIVVHASGHVVQPSTFMNPSALPLASHETRDWTSSLDLVERLIREESIAGAEAKTLLSDPAECRAAAPTTSRRSRHAHVKPGLSSRRRGRALQCGPAGETPYAAHLGRSRSAVRLSCRNSISRLRLGSYFVRDDDHRRERVGCDMP
jgi:hypothetical protein